MLYHLRIPLTPLAFADPLTEEELELFAELLDEHATLGLDAVLGVLHGVAVAPGLLPPAVWLELVLPKAARALTTRDGAQIGQMAMRLFAEVLTTLAVGEVAMPGASAPSGCDAFAYGYASAAALDPKWRRNPLRWKHASWAAYLGGRLELVPPATLADLQRGGEAGKTDLHQRMDALVLDGYESFLTLRQASNARRRIPA